MKKVIITGGAGFVGQVLVLELLAKGYEVVVIDRQLAKLPVSTEVIDLEKVVPKPSLFENAYGVIHLAGSSIFRRWTKQVKQSIYASRIESTKNLTQAIERTTKRPRVLVSASATGFYGDRAEEELTEDSKAGNDWLAKVCIDWEQEARRVEKRGIRTVQVRTAPVLGPGGLLSILVPIFRLGLGGPIGKGKQWFPWIHRQDLVNIYIEMLENANYRGPVNASAPVSARFSEFATILAYELKRPAWFRIPSWLVSLLYGQFASVVTASQKVIPRKLEKAGYKFKFPSLKPALANLLEK